LIPSDIGRPITDLVLGLDYPSLADEVRTVLQTLIPAEKRSAAKDGRRYNVRIMPYRTLDDRIDGVVITFADITVAWKLEMELRTEQAALKAHIAGQPQPQDATKAKRRKSRGDITRNRSPQ
jgi:two-component system CheB/CheR fusion protein